MKEEGKCQPTLFYKIYKLPKKIANDNRAQK